MADIENKADESSVVARLHELIKKLSKEEQQALLGELEERLFKKTRKHERKPFFTTLDYSTESGSYRDFIKDISMEGVFIETRIPFSVGEVLSMTFLLPEHEKKVKIHGEIVRIDEQGIGVKFKSSQVQKEIIKSFVDMV
ncbi:MAG: PilZ domain-containing protein [Deltaproteobacteria bacterium]|nr:PilZ domain-containing protein [Deltaproteobacteria bacterium]